MFSTTPFVVPSKKKVVFCSSGSLYLNGANNGFNPQRVAGVHNTMERLTFLREAIQNALQGLAAFLKQENDGLDHALVFDVNSDNYVYLYSGWRNKRYIHMTVVHLGIRGDKIHVFHDGIEDSIVDDLLEAGVLESEIVIERHSPFTRQFTPFAVS